MPTYPTLSQNPEFPIITEPIWDTSIVHYKGKVEQRKSNIAQEKSRFRFRYKAISTADKDLLQNFFISVKGPHKKFDWTNPKDENTYTVKFENGALDVRHVSNTPQDKVWNIGEIRLIEVI